ncbi:MAG: cupin domain-containing protein [Alphaproteobacteria bacterium]|nr:cupin domain-containing protein [Alphaproteobacteria bacterium]
MIQRVDLGRDLDDLVRLKDRGPHTTEKEAQASFRKLAEFRDGGLFAANFSGSSGWERHTKGDEIVQILEGSTRFDIIVDDKIETYELGAGALLVVPQGCWHRFTSEDGVKVLTATPQTTQHLHVDDPRTVSGAG